MRPHPDFPVDGLRKPDKVPVSEPGQHVLKLAADGESSGQDTIVGNRKSVVGDRKRAANRHRVAPRDRAIGGIWDRLGRGVQGLCASRGGDNSECGEEKHVDVPATRDRGPRFHCHTVLATIALTGCAELPDVQYVTDRIELGVSFDATVCAGTLDDLDAHVDNIEFTLGLGHNPEPIRAYWLSPAETQDICGEDRGGCFFPATRIAFSSGTSLKHELLHVVLDSKGESYFIEEGLAEMFSGAGVSHDPDDSSVSVDDRLKLSRADYRGGELDYTAASHFVRWVYETGGPSAMIALANEIEQRSSANQVADRLSLVMSVSLEEIEDSYRSDAPKYYPGLGHKSLPFLNGSLSEEGTEVSLDCADDNTRGPWADGVSAAYRVFQVRIPHRGIAVLEVGGPSDAFAELIDPRASLSRGWVQSWVQPDAALDPNSAHVLSGERQLVDVRAGDYLLVVGTGGVQPETVTVHLTPPTPRSGRMPHRVTGPRPPATR